MENKLSPIPNAIFNLGALSSCGAFFYHLPAKGVWASLAIGVAFVLLSGVVAAFIECCIQGFKK